MILVTGATGRVGSHVARSLRDQGVRVRAFVRDRDRAAALLGSGIELAVGDFGDASGVRRALDAVDTVLLACSNQPEQYTYETGVIDAAVAAGVERLVKLSALGAAIGSPLAFWHDHGRIEEHLRRASLRYVVLRSGGYMTTLLMAAAQVREQGVLFAPLAGGAISMIDPRDVADVAVAALTSSAHDRQTYLITGGEAISYERAAEEITAATHRPVAFVNVPDDAAREAMLADGLPPWIADQLITMFGLIRQGALARVTDTVSTILGREPRTLSAFVREHAHLFTPLAPGPVTAG